MLPIRASFSSPREPVYQHITGPKRAIIKESSSQFLCSDFVFLTIVVRLFFGLSVFEISGSKNTALDTGRKAAEKLTSQFLQVRTPVSFVLVNSTC